MRALPLALLAAALCAARAAAAPAGAAELDTLLDSRPASDKAVSVEAGGLHSDSSAKSDSGSSTKGSSTTALGASADGGLKDAQLEKGATLHDHFDAKAAAKKAAVADEEDPQAGGNPNDAENCRTEKGYCKALIDSVIQKTKMVAVFPSVAAMPKHVASHGEFSIENPGEGFSVAWTAGVPGAHSHGGECDVAYTQCADPRIVTWVSRTPGGKALCATPAGSS